MEYVLADLNIGSNFVGYPFHTIVVIIISKPLNTSYWGKNSRDSMFRCLDITEIICFLSGIMRLEAHARQDVAFLGTEFLKLDSQLVYLVLLMCYSSLASNHEFHPQE